MGGPVRDELENSEGVEPVVQEDHRPLMDALHKTGEEAFVRCA